MMDETKISKLIKTLSEKATEMIDAIPNMDPTTETYGRTLQNLVKTLALLAGTTHTGDQDGEKGEN